jgi:3-oxoadipate enol-lactonase
MPFVDRRDARIWWQSDGSGPPVLLIMGLGMPLDMWHPLMPALTRGYRAIRLDNRGSGRSSIPAGPYLVEQMAEDAAAVLDAAGEGNAHVIGASLGGLIAQELAIRHPNRVRSLVLMCTGVGGPQAPRTAVQQRIDSGERVPPAEMVSLLFAPTTRRERIDESLEVLMRQPVSPEGLANQVAGGRAYGGSYERLSQVRQPALILHGTGDQIVDPANAQLLASALPQARLELLEGAGHGLLTDEPQRSANLITEFLDRASMPNAD